MPAGYTLNRAVKFLRYKKVLMLLSPTQKVAVALVEHVKSFNWTAEWRGGGEGHGHLDDSDIK